VPVGAQYGRNRFMRPKRASSAKITRRCHPFDHLFPPNQMARRITPRRRRKPSAQASRHLFQELDSSRYRGGIRSLFRSARAGKAVTRAHALARPRPRLILKTCDSCTRSRPWC
jgi:hypothetical protein